MFTYSNERHATILANRGYNEDEVLGALKETTGAELKNLLFDDTIAFLENFKSYGEPMILLSLGNTGFQELKTKGSGIDAYFDRVFMVHDTKAHVLKELFDAVHEETVWFVNDKIQETQKLLAVFPQLKPILKISKRFEKSDYTESGIPSFETLVEIQKYVAEHR